MSKRSAPPCPSAVEVVGSTDLTGRTFFITGANSGIGFETARVLHCSGATVVLGCRTRVGYEDAISRLRGELPSQGEASDRLIGVEVDLSRQSSVKKCVGALPALLGESFSIDSLILNAGVCDVPYSLTEDGFESTLAINCYGHFLLMLLLLPSVSRRVVFVSSFTYVSAELNLDLLPKGDPESYDGVMQYCNTKLMNLLVARELQRRLRTRGSTVLSFSLHPGTIKTAIGRHSSRANQILEEYEDRGVEHGASTTVFAALDEVVLGEDVGGSYLLDCAVGTPLTPQSQDNGLAQELFEHCESVIGVSFDSIPLGTE